MRYAWYPDGLVGKRLPNACHGYDQQHAQDALSAAHFLDGLKERQNVQLSESEIETN